MFLLGLAIAATIVICAVVVTVLVLKYQINANKTEQILQFVKGNDDKQEGKILTTKSNVRLPQVDEISDKKITATTSKNCDYFAAQFDILSLQILDRTKNNQIVADISGTILRLICIFVSIYLYCIWWFRIS